MQWKQLFLGFLLVSVGYYFRNVRCPLAPDETIVKTNFGSLRGQTSLSRGGRKFYKWLGIPYATPPVGELRFESPQPLDTKWHGVRDARYYESSCAQTEFILLDDISGSEDCLYLNVYVPKIENKSSLLPVMFYIHGGNFMRGAGKEHKPDYFMDEDVVLVTINYRLNALGFLNTGDGVARGNMGLKDQSTALKWVKENIIPFGGDSNKITIFGNSAGGASVHLQMMSPISRGFFQRAISQSGTGLAPWVIEEDPVGRAKIFSRQLNCPTETSVEMVKCLKKVELTEILEAYRSPQDHLGHAFHNNRLKMFSPSVETVLDAQTFLPDRPLNLILSGNAQNISWLTGVTADEALFLTYSILTPPEYPKRLKNDWNYINNLLILNKTDKHQSEKVKRFYLGGDTTFNLVKQFRPITNLLSDRLFTQGVYKAASASLGLQNAPVQLYFYTQAGPSILEIFMMIKAKFSAKIEFIIAAVKFFFNTVILHKRSTNYGVSHGDEMFMLFENSGIHRIDKDDSHFGFSRDLVKAWVSFASSPNVEDANFRGVKFPSVKSKEEIMVLEIKNEPTIRKFPFLERMRFWESVARKDEAI